MLLIIFVLLFLCSCGKWKQGVVVSCRIHSGSYYYEFFLWLFFGVLFLCNYDKSYSATILNCKKQDRNDYYRIIFELEKKPSYFVYQLGEKIYVRLQNTTKPQNNCLGLKYEIYNNSIEYEINSKTNSLKRYLYIEPNKNSKNYQLVVDIYKREQEFENIENFLSTKIGGNTTSSEKTMDDLIKEVSDVTLDELIMDNVKADNLEELIALHNIIDEKVAENLEKQNNDGVDLNKFIDQIAKETKKTAENQKKTTKKVVKNTYVVVIDAGHGGNDPGAIGKYRKAKEKNINLDFANEIRKKLQKNKNLKVYMTREDDRFISLKNRVIFSIRKNADLFISIHSDSNPSRNARGLSIYTFLNNSLSSRHSYYSMDSVLNDINMKNKVANSEKFTRLLIDNFNKSDVDMLYRPHKHAKFTVLSMPDYPSVLIELGFLSNRYDEELLRSSSYRFKVAESVAKSVNSYFGL